MPLRVLVTGGSGFLARHLAMYLVRNSCHSIRVSSRNPLNQSFAEEVEVVSSPDLTDSEDWTRVLTGIDVVVHTAGRAHILRELSGKDPLTSFREVNVLGTLSLADQAARAGVGRFIFISSIGVNGSSSVSPYTEANLPNPSEPYAVSKLEAETLLHQLCRECEMSLTIIRPPLVYGAGARGNFLRLVNLVRREWPLPFGRALAPRSFIGVENLCHFISTCLEHEMADNELFVVSDDEDIPTAMFIRMIGKTYGCRVRLLPIPQGIMRVAMQLAGQKKIYSSLFDSLQVDCHHAKERLGWRPLYSVRQGLERCAVDEGQENLGKW